MNCLLVDDEPLALEVLKAHIQTVPFLEVVGECNHALAAFDYLQKNQAGLIFLGCSNAKIFHLHYTELSL